MNMRPLLAGVSAAMLLLSSTAVLAATTTAGATEVYKSATGNGLYVTSISTVNDQTLKIAFSEALSSDAVALKIVQDSDKTEVMVDSSTPDASKKTLEVKLSTPLLVSEKYSLFVTSAKSTSGKTLAQTTSGTSFTTPEDLAFADDAGTSDSGATGKATTVKGGADGIAGTVTADGEASTSGPAGNYSAPSDPVLNSAGSDTDSGTTASDTGAISASGNTTDMNAAGAEVANTGALVTEAKSLPKTGPESTLLFVLTMLATPAVIYLFSLKKQA